MFAPTIQSLNFTNRQKKNQILHPLFLLQNQAQKKKLSKRKAPLWRFRALRSATTAVGGRHRLLKKAGENFIMVRENFIMVRKNFLWAKIFAQQAKF